MSRRRAKLLAYAALSWPPHAIGYVLVPILVSRLGVRHGWKHSRPGPLNLTGLPFLLAGVGLIAWAIGSHYRAGPDEVQFRVAPNYLATNGAYGFTRNPLYLGGGSLWAGWAVLLGSVPIAVAGTALFGLLDAVGVPFEERMLENRFGDVYTTYRNRVPRWVSLRP